MKSKRIMIIALAAVLAVTTILLTWCLWTRHGLMMERSTLLDELESSVGTYDAQKIILSDTTKARAEELAKKYGASLRITTNGRFATLTLPEGVTIKDICSDEANLSDISDFSIDYMSYSSEEREYVRRASKPEDFSVSDTDYDKQTYLDYLHIGKAWSNGYLGNNVTVAVIDTGIDTDHPEFYGKISEYSYNATEDKIVKDYSDDGGYDWSLIEDTQGHGTAVSGVIAAQMDGVGTVGLAPNVNLIVIKAKSNEKGQFLNTSDLVFGLYYAIERDVDVINMSFGGVDNIFADALRLAKDSDILCIASAGNDSTAALSYPAADENCIGVGALEDGGWTLAEYSNYGENTNLVAPGTVYTTKMGGGYDTVSGTSFASPVVVGALAMMKSHWNYKYETNSTVTEILYASCSDLGDPGCDWYYGYGALDINTLLCEEQGKVTFNMLTDELENTTQVFIRNHTLQAIPEPERLYAVFDGWYYDIECTEAYNWYDDKFVTDLTLYANWCNEDDGIPYTYVVLDDNTVEIRSYTGKRRYITIPKKIDGKIVSSIGDEAFAEQSKLVKVTLPESLTNIGMNAFCRCSNLVNVDIPNTVKTIGECAFADCIRLSSVEISENSELTTIGTKAFSNCANLKNIYLPEKLESVDGSAFFGSTSMKNIEVSASNRYFVSLDGVLYNKAVSKIIAYPAGMKGEFHLPSTITSVGDYAFGFTRLETVELDGVVSIGSYAFAGSHITEIEIPDSVNSLGGAAFLQCQYLTDITLGDGITTIPGNCFMMCLSLTDISIPGNVFEIGRMAFAFSSLQTVSFAEVGNLTIIGANAFASCPLSGVTIPKSVMQIGAEAFFQCFMLKSVTFADESLLQSIGEKAFESTSIISLDLPTELRSIGRYAFKDTSIAGTVTIPASVDFLDYGVFASCTELSAIDVEDRNSVYESFDGVVYTKDGKTLIAYPTGNDTSYYAVREDTSVIYGAAFYGAKKINQIYLPESLTEISEYAFSNCARLWNMTIPQNVITIGRYAFENTEELYSVDFNENAKISRLGFAAFAFSGINSIRIPASVSTISQDAFAGCKRLYSVSFEENSQLESISAYMFDGAEALQTIMFGNGSSLKSIQAHGFEGMSSLYSVDFGDAKLTNIDNYAFRYCSNLATVTVPDSLESIGRFAFYGCSNFSELSVPKSLEHIGSYAFHGTNNCALYFASDVLPFYLDENWDNGLSGYYTGVQEIVTSGDWKYAVQTNSSIAILEYLGTDTTIDLTNLGFGTIETIGGYAFEGKNLISITMPSSIKQIQRYAFANNRELKSITIPAETEYIAKYAFSNTGIETLTFAGEKVRKIEQNAFEYTRELTSVTIPASVESLGSYVFWHSGIQSVTFENGSRLTEIPKYAFAYSEITSVSIPDSVTVISTGAFRDCVELETVSFGKGEDLEIYANAFYNTGLSNVTIPANARYIGEYAFVGLKNLQSYTVAPENKNYKSVDGVLYNKAGTKLIAFPAGRAGSFVVPSTVETIGFGAFENSSLTSVQFANGINLLSIGYRAFFNADELSEISIPASVVSIDYYAFAQCDSLTTVTFADDCKLNGIYEGAFFGDARLEEITLPDSIIEISDYAFYGCHSLDRLPISETSGLKGVYSYAFAYTGLTGELALPETLIDIGDYAFEGCGMTAVTISDANKYELMIGIGAFKDCSKLEEITLPFIGAGYEDLEYSWFGWIFGAGNYTANQTYIPTSLKNVSFNGDVRTAGVGAFYYVTSIERIDGLENLTTIYPHSFWDSTFTYQLNNQVNFVDYDGKEIDTLNMGYIGQGVVGKVIVSDYIKYIDYLAFYDCTDLTEVVLPDGLLSMNDCSFSGCRSLEVNIPASVTFIAQSAFGYGVHDVDFDEQNTIYSFKDGILYDKDFTEIILPISPCGIVTIPGTVATIPDAIYGYQQMNELILSEGVKEIEAQAFRDISSLTKVTLPSTLEKIGDGAFTMCLNLCYVINNSTLNLEFLDNHNNGGVAGNAEVIEESDGTKRYRNPDNPIEYIDTDDGFRFQKDNYGYKLIAYMGKESTVTLPYDIYGNTYEIYHMQGVRNVIIPEGFEKISDYAFYNCTSLISISFPSTLKEIGCSAFYCTSLTTVTIPEGVEVIQNLAFSSCNLLKDVYIPSSVREMYANTFFGQISNVSLHISPENKNYRAIDGILYQTGEDLRMIKVVSDVSGDIVLPSGLVSIPSTIFHDNEKITSVTVPEGVKTIEADAFIYCSNLSRIVLPDSLESLGMYSIEYCPKVTRLKIGKNVKYIGGSFEGMDNLTLILDEENEHFVEVDGIIYTKDMTTLVYANPTISGEIVLPPSLTTIECCAFSNCSNEFSLVLPDSMSRLDSFAFRFCSGLTEIKLPKNLKEIGYGSFDSCSKLSHIEIPDGVTHIDEYAFHSSVSGGLRSIVLPKSLETIGLNAFLGNDNLKIIFNNSDLPLTIGSAEYGGVAQYAEIIINSDGTVQKNDEYDDVILENDFLFVKTGEKYQLRHYFGSDDIVVLPTEFRGLPVEWYQVGGIKNAVIPDGVTKVPSAAFEYNSQLKTVVIPESVKEIEDEAFYMCSGLSELDLPDGLTTIGNGAFGGCSSLKSVSIPDSVSDLGWFAFWNCSNLVEVSLPNSIDIINDSMFASCKKLSHISFPDAVKIIGFSAFAYCESLSEIELPDELESIGSYAFFETAYYYDEGNWSNGELYLDDWLLDVKDNVRFANENKKKVADGAFTNAQTTIEHCYSGNGSYVGDLTNLRDLVILDLPYGINPRDYFWGYQPTTTLEAVILSHGCDITSPNAFYEITGITILVEDEKIDCPWDDDYPGWNNGNKVLYGGEWSRATYRNTDGEIIAIDYYRENEVIRPPYIDTVKNGDTAYEFVGWDITGDGVADSLPATVVGSMEFKAVMHQTVASYQVRFVDGSHVISEQFVSYGETVCAPEPPEKTGYTFLLWNGYSDGMKVTQDMTVYAEWSHNGGGHDYTETVVEATCCDDGYTLHTCTICGESYKTNVTTALGHTFGEWQLTKNATCTTAGEMVRECYCGERESKIIPPTHQFVANVTKEATCCEYGIITYKCAECGETFTEPVQMLQHNYKRVFGSDTFVKTLSSEMNSFFYGYEKKRAYYYVCQDCGHLMTVDEYALSSAASVQGTGCSHELGDWATYVAGSHRIEVRRCLKCGEIKEARTASAQGVVCLFGQITSYNPNNSTTIELMQDGVVMYTTTIAATTGNGPVTQEFTLTDVAPGTYDLVVTKDGHLAYTITGIVVADEDLDLTLSDKAYSNIKMIAGDVNGDGYVNATDWAILWSDDNYLKSTAVVQNKLCDINGDGSVNATDWAILWSDDNYLKGKDSTTFGY